MHGQCQCKSIAERLVVLVVQKVCKKLVFCSKSKLQARSLQQNFWVDTFLSNLFWAVLFEAIILYFMNFLKEFELTTFLLRVR